MKRRFTVASENSSSFFKRFAAVVGAGVLSFLLFLARPSVESIDSDRDGKIEKRTYYWEGKRIRQEIDSNGDGKTDIWKIYRDGTAVELRTDNNYDGKVDAWAQYGEGENLATYRADTDFDGKVDFSGPYPFGRGKSDERH